MSGGTAPILRARIRPAGPVAVLVAAVVMPGALVAGAFAVPAAAQQAQDPPPHEVPFPDPTGEEAVAIPHGDGTDPAGSDPGEGVPGTETRGPVDIDELGPLPDPATAPALHVKFATGRPVAVAATTVEGVGETDAARLERALRRANATIEPLFSRSRRGLDRDRRALEARTGLDQIDLSQWFRVVLGDPAQAQRLLDTLNGLSSVEVALPEPTLAPAGAAQPPPPNLEPNQLHRDAAPVGVDADHAATVSGGTGAHVRVFDLEYSWRTSHEDLTAAVGAELVNGVPVDPEGSDTHGTAVLGVIAADANGFGVTGIVPDAELALVNVHTSEGAALADAIDLAAANATPGDVIVIEQQLCPVTVVRGICEPGWLPVEWFPSFYDAIVSAVGRGVTVIEAGGNGARNIDTQLRFPDSGAIIVGAGNPSVACNHFGAEPARGRLDFSNYGTRMDLQGHGACVWTTGADGGAVNPTAPPDQRYTASFSGTSSAAAIAAGAAAAMSSVAIGSGDLLAPHELRALLRATGTAQDRSVDGKRIGPLPDLRAAIASFRASPHGAPVNDDFFAPLGLGRLPIAHRQDTAGASVQSGEPVPTCGRPDTTVWFRHRSAFDVSVGLTTAGARPGPSVAVWEVVGGELREVGCSRSAVDPVADPLRLALRGGRTYMIQVGNTAGAPVDLRLTGAPRCDIDGDGFGDALVGARRESIGTHAQAGAVHVLHGRAAGTPERVPILSQASAAISGRAERGDHFGASLACADIDADGYDDAIVGVPGEGLGRRHRAGAVQIVYGTSRGLGARDQLITQASGNVPGRPESGDAFGSTVATGDINGDGYADVIVGAVGESIRDRRDAGMVTILFGSGRGLSLSHATAIHQDRPGITGRAERGDRLGNALATGDADRDGYDDVFIGVAAENLGLVDVGAVIVVPGGPEGPVTTEATWFAPNQTTIASPPEARIGFGTALAVADLDGDGHLDLAVGVPGSTWSQDASGGWVDVIAGSAEGVGTGGSVRVAPSTRGVDGASRSRDRFGASLAVNDANGSATAELYVGAPGATVRGRLGAGAATAIALDKRFRVVTSTTVTQQSPGVPGRPERYDGFAGALVADDLDGDGLGDLVVGIAGEDLSGTGDAGMAVVLGGKRSGMPGAAIIEIHQDVAGVGGSVEPFDRFADALG